MAQAVRASRLVLAFIGASGVVWLGDPAWADDLSLTTPAYARLAAPISAVVDGLGFRLAIERLGTSAAVNVCVDRHVDPDRVVRLGQAGPTVYKAMENVAKQNGCLVTVFDEVVLIGRPEWLAATVGQLHQIEAVNRATTRADIDWPELTTPAEALSMVLQTDLSSTLSSEIPHDLWPATTWRQLSRPIAAALVLAQLDRQMTTPTLWQRPDALTLVRLKPPVASITRVYKPFKKDENAAKGLLRKLQTAGRSADRQSIARMTQQGIELEGRVVAHIQATSAWFAAAHQSGTIKVSSGEAKYTLKMTNQPADQALGQFAATAGKRIVIEPSAADACRQRVSLEVVDQTLREIAIEVARQIDVTLVWTESETVTVRAK
ncbi:MAG: hypothetical protein AAGA03_09955 [Planctomycetota bacterium]